MKEVEAIKCLKTLSLIKQDLNGDALDVFELGLQLALRVTDLLSIKFEDVKNGRIQLLEGKTGKIANIVLNDKAKGVIEHRRRLHPYDEYLFQSRGSRTGNRVIPIQRNMVSSKIKKAGDKQGIAISSHSMRKTRGFHIYDQTGDIGLVMKVLRHSSEAVTLRYIGITQDNIDKTFTDIQL